MSSGALPAPRSPLGRHRLLSPSASVKVSPLCLGGMSFGTNWENWLGSTDKKTVFEILDYFRSQGGNFIDTANGYQDNQSEEWIGEWMKERGCRDEMVIATKFTANFRSFEKKQEGANSDMVISNFGGNGTKSLRHSLEASLKKLQTDYVDILYLHCKHPPFSLCFRPQHITCASNFADVNFTGWELTTSIPEVMQSLNDLVRAGKILYLGVSDTPAWIVSKANQYARDHGLRQFVVYQGEWNAAKRDFERDIIPMCASEEMGICPWGALGGGKFKSDEARKQSEGRKVAEVTEQQVKVSKALEKLAKEKGAAITGVALAYVIQRAPYVFPICGGRTTEHLKGNIEALSLALSEEEIKEIEDAWPFDTGFPLSFLSRSPAGAKGPGDVVLARQGGEFEYVEGLKPIKPTQK
ncbi:hypothetical protein MMC30_001152 [Trapelia coarctata]|nr:hypothetical protein [Trapelia coarctata]